MSEVELRGREAQICQDTFSETGTWLGRLVAIHEMSFKHMITSFQGQVYLLLAVWPLASF